MFANELKYVFSLYMTKFSGENFSQMIAEFSRRFSKNFLADFRRILTQIFEETRLLNKLFA